MNDRVINQSRRNLNRSYKINENVCVYSKGQTKAHTNAIWRVFTFLRDLDYNVVTEAYFTNGSRADLYCLDTDVAYEIMQSEKYESIEIKRTKYPCIVIALKAEDVLKATDEELEKML